MKILEDKGYTYVGYLSSGGEGDVHIVKVNSTLLISKIVKKLDASAYEILRKIQQSDIPNIPKIHEIFNHLDKTYIIREYVEGKTLYEVLQEEGHFSYDRAKSIILQICETISAFHNLKPHPIIYRDLKPDNIILTKDDEVRLIDFGIARYHKKEAVRDTVLAGTRGYSAPEIMAGMQSDKRSDIYSIGLLFYEMLTGKNLQLPPFQVRPVTESVDDLPLWLDKLIAKSTGISMVTRFRDTEEFVFALNNPDSLKEKPANKIKPWHIILTACFSIAILLAVLLINQFNSRTDTTDNSKAEADTTIDAPQSSLYTIDLDLQFDDPADADWLIPRYDDNYAQDKNFDLRDDVADGILSPRCGYDMQYTISPGSIFHMRIKPNAMSTDVEFGESFMTFCIVPTYNYDVEDAAIYNIHFEENLPVSTQIRRRNYGYYFSQSQGDTIIPDDKWLDYIITLSEDGTEFKYYISESDNDKLISYGGGQMEEEYIGADYSLYATARYDDWLNKYGEIPVSEVDFIRYAKGNINAYMEDYLFVYSNRKDTIDEFIEKDIEEISLNEYQRHNLEETGYEMMQTIEFDTSDDAKWIEDYGFDGTGYEISDGILHILESGIGYGIKYNINNDYLIHYRAKGTEATALSLGPYRVNLPCAFECIHCDDNTGDCDTTFNIPMLGANQFATNQYYDVIMYTTIENDAVYALVIDDETGNISYVGYNVDSMAQDTGNNVFERLSPDIMNFKNTEEDQTYVDFIRIARGSLERYVQGNFESYSRYEQEITELFDVKIDDLPRFEFVK